MEVHVRYVWHFYKMYYFHVIALNRNKNIAIAFLVPEKLCKYIELDSIMNITGSNSYILLQDMQIYAAGGNNNT